MRHNNYTCSVGSVG